MREVGELCPPAFRNRFGQAIRKLAEKQKGGVGAELFPHKEKRRRRGQQKNGRDGAYRLRLGESQDSFSERSISYLIVILQECNEAGER